MMENTQEAPEKGYDLEKQSSISVGLIGGIVVMLILLMNIAYSTEDEQLFQLPVISGVMTLLLGGYVAVYRGKGHLLSRVLFVISLVVTVLLICGLLYLSALGQAYQH